MRHSSSRSANAGAARRIWRWTSFTLASVLTGASLPSVAQAAVLTIQVRDAVSGQPTACRLQLQGPNGYYFATPDRTMRTRYAPWFGPYVYVDGTLVVSAQTGQHRVIAVRGPTGIPVDLSFPLASDTTITVALGQWIDPRDFNLCSADPHIHLEHDQERAQDPDVYPPADLAEAEMMTRAEKLDVMYMLSNDAQHPGGPAGYPSAEATLMWGEEYRSSYWGHVVLLGLQQLVVTSIGAGCCGTGLPAWPTLNAIFSATHPPLAIIAHPHTTDDPNMHFGWPGSGQARELYALALGDLVHGFSVGSGSNALDPWCVDDYLDAVRAGARWAALGEGDRPLDRYFLPPPGAIRTYAQVQDVPPRGSAELGLSWEAAVRQGRCFASSGPVVRYFDVAGHSYGSAVSLPGPRTASVSLGFTSLAQIQHVRLHGAAGLHWSVDWPVGRSVLDTTLAIPVDHDDFVVLELGGADTSPLRWDRPRAVTSPVWIVMGTPWPVPVATARRGVEKLRDVWRRSLFERGYTSAADSAASASYFLTAADVYESMVDDPPRPVRLAFPPPGRLLPAEEVVLRWTAAGSYDHEPVTYRVAMDTSAVFSMPQWSQSTPDTFLTVSDLAAGQRYQWTVEVSEPGDAPLMPGAPVQWFQVSANPTGVPGAPGAALAVATPQIEAGRVLLSFTLAGPRDVELSCFDVRGRRISSQRLGRTNAGEHQVTWAAQDQHGARVARGVYWLVLSAGTDSAVRQVLLAR